MHKSSKTAEICTHVSERNIATVRSSLDEIMAVRRAKGRELDSVKLANSSSDIPPAGIDSRTKVRG